MYPALLLANVVVFALVLAAYLRHRARGWFHPLTIYLAFHALVFVLRPVLAWVYGYTLVYRVFEFWPDEYAKAMALVAANVGLLSFAAASLAAGNARFVNRHDEPAACDARALARPLWVLAIVLLPLIAYSLDLEWRLRADDMRALELDLATGTTINAYGSNGYAQEAYTLGVTLVPLIAWIGRFRPWTLVLVAGFAFLVAGAGIRGPAIATLALFGFLYLYARRPKLFDWRIAVAGAFALALFNLVGSDRGYAIRSLFTNAPGVAGASAMRLAPLEGMDTGNLEYLEYLTDKVPRRTGTYEYFVDNLQAFTEPIPRVLWKEKPIGQPIRLFNLFDYGFPIGMTRSLPGEGWTQLGLIGVVIWCGLWGLAFGFVYQHYARGPQSVIQTALYFTLLAMLIVFFRDGLLITLLRQGIFLLAPPLLWAAIAHALGGAPAAALARGPDRRAGTASADRPRDGWVPRSRRHRPTRARRALG